jgi:hypothetical protein
LPDLRVDTVKISDLGDVALDSRDLGTNGGDRIGELVLSTARYVDKCALFDKLLRCGETAAGAAAGYKGNFTFKFL